MSQYEIVPPKAALKPTKFNISIPGAELSGFRELLKLSKLGPKTYENHQADGRFGVTYQWLSEAKTYWETKFDWRARETYINSFPNFTAPVKDDDGAEYTIHFIALFSERNDAIPLIFLHGWPGSFLEFLDMLSLLKKKYPPKELPYHVIVPSLPGCAFSSDPPLERDWTLKDTARLLHKLMMGLGFESGYAVQGGDIGSYLARILCTQNEACKLMHPIKIVKLAISALLTSGKVNFCVMRKPEMLSQDSYDETESRCLTRTDQFIKTGAAYAMEHGTRPATIGFVLSSSPLATLAWISEKFVAWTDTTPSLETILDSVTLYYLTSSFPTCIYPYREEVTAMSPRKSFGKSFEHYMLHSDPAYYCKKPFGFSWFPKEIAPVPRSWIESTADKVWFRRHDRGGHFAAMEEPEVVLEDVEAFLADVWHA